MAWLQPLAPCAPSAPPLATPFARRPSALFGGTFASEFDPVGLLQFLYLFGSHFPFRLCQYLAQAASKPIRKSLMPCAIKSPLWVARNAFQPAAKASRSPDADWVFLFWPSRGVRP